MSKARHTIALFATLFVFWVLLNGTLAPDTLVIGVLVALAIALLFPNSLSALDDLAPLPRVAGAVVRFLAYFIIQLVKANVALAYVVLAPSLPINPGIVKVRTKLKSPVGRLLLANAITLTPGTLSVQLEDEFLYVHWVTVDSDDIEAATASIVAGFEKELEVIYG
ncbi:MAG: Na+/H+ antiporter subunit E [Rhodobacterales bacterium]|nr:Na+/H+ antiporter subunit E [Rhodobacterales bacterium]